MKEMDIGLKIKEIRTNKGLSQQDLAEALGVSKQRISQMETGGFDMGFNMIRKVLHILDHDILIIRIPKLNK